MPTKDKYYGWISPEGEFIEVESDWLHSDMARKICTDRAIPINYNAEELKTMTPEEVDRKRNYSYDIEVLGWIHVSGQNYTRGWNDSKFRGGYIPPTEKQKATIIARSEEMGHRPPGWVVDVKPEEEGYL